VAIKNYLFSIFGDGRLVTPGIIEVLICDLSVLHIHDVVLCWHIIA